MKIWKYSIPPGEIYLSDLSLNAVTELGCFSILVNKVNKDGIILDMMKVFTTVTRIWIIIQLLSFNCFHGQDTFRAEWAWLILFAPERVPGMICSMLQDYHEVSVVTGFLCYCTYPRGIS